MVNQQVVQALQEAFRRQQPEAEIRAQLVAQGWSEFDIGLAWQAAQTAATAEPQKKLTSHRVSAPEILLFIGGMIVVLGAVTLIASGWNALAPIGRMLAAVIPNAILLIAGLFFMRNQQVQRAGHAFLVTAGLAFPATLLIILQQITDGTNIDFNVLMLITAGVTMLVYAAMIKLYRGLVWMLLFVLASYFAYVSLLAVLKIEQIGIEMIYAWAFLFFGLAWLLIGGFIERAKHQFYARAPYAIGSIATMLSLLTLGFTGTLFGNSADKYADISNSSLRVMLTVFVVGVLFLGAGYFVTYLGQKGLHELKKFSPLWDFVGVIVTVAAFLTGIGESSEVNFSILAIVLSLLFVFLAIRLQNRQYFHAGSAMLAISILTTGFRYFSDSLGWPIVLMGIGLLFMAGGYFLVRIQRQYFSKKSTPSQPLPPFTPPQA